MKVNARVVLLAVILIGGLVAGITLWRESAKAPDGMTGGERVPTVILICVDTLRADRLACYGYQGHSTPNLDALAAEGVLFEHCYTPMPLTLPAHTSMFTGTSPVFHRVRDNTMTTVPEKGMTTIAELFAASGYQTAGFVSSKVMEKASGIARGFQHWDDNLDRDAAGAGLLLPERHAEATLTLAREWIEAQPKDKPKFVFIHLFDPHFPYEAPDPKYRQGLQPPRTFTGEELSPHYDAEVRYVDAKLGEFFEQLRASGIWNDALVALTADHGEGLGEYGELTHGYFLHDPCTHVPLIIRMPKGSHKGTRVKAAVSLMDIMPTLAGVCGLELKDIAASQQQGEDLRPFVTGERKGIDRAVYFESHYGYQNAGWARIRGMRSAEWTAFIHDSTPEYYLDDAQRVNLLAKPSDQSGGANDAYLAIRDRVSKLLSTWYNPGLQRRARGSSTSTGYQEAGYHEGAYQEGAYHEAKDGPYGVEGTPYPGEAVGGSRHEPESLSDSVGRPSPHNRAAALDAYQRAELLYSRGRHESTLRNLDELLKTEPELLPALRLAARSSEIRARDERRDEDVSRSFIARAAEYATRAEVAAMKAGMTLAALDIASSGLLWRLMVGEADAVRTRAEQVLEKHRDEMTVDLRDRYLRLQFMAAYRLAGDSIPDRMTIGRVLEAELKSPKAHRDLVTRMCEGKPLPLAPWEIR